MDPTVTVTHGAIILHGSWPPRVSAEHERLEDLVFAAEMTRRSEAADQT